MKAGSLNNYIYVYSQALADAGCVGFGESFSLKGECWAKVSPYFEAGNDERFTDRKITNIQTYRITTRFNIGFSFIPTDIIKFGDKILRVQGISNKDEGDYTISVNAIAIQNDQAELILTGVFDEIGEPAFDEQGNAFFSEIGV